ncbi:hypothetical protein EMIHUDRAFT_258976 [Emiliania huxleyi CCMP1516]|uniref:Uncharacterized protein n=2 Tax=Emiliania huxleyi TaxID=2903 RepID=A0A0D3I4S9_EMIH1|nr:hypothetical protein EMIHUDRAFT_258976 [Emiliania huxleyi CCMP1516]EOD06264.1 hypothetical protein EMIHUDRAFT_258976 [Emiliania huxleyi CCMP1516]|eukprot:XP_005758693.1 hypothetical protein EMIHUDRAFT_258976 [Emiliania huxleyi CCMP1516]
MAWGRRPKRLETLLPVGPKSKQSNSVSRRATYPTLEHDDHDPGPLAERIRRDKREFSIFGAERIRRDRSSDDSSSDRDSCGTGSTSEANDIFDTLEDHLGYGSDSGSGW